MTWGRQNITKGDRIVTTQMEHHANLIPWLKLSMEKKAELKYIPINEDGYLELDDIDRIITPKTKIVAVTQMSNVLGTINPVDKIIERAHDVGALVLIDGAQSTPHMPVDVRAMDTDFFVFSAHKMLGPTGIGFLYGKEKILKEMEPFITGGEMISQVSFENVTWNELPWKFEAGTPNIAGAVAFSSALDYLSNLGMDAVRQHEIELTTYALKRLNELPFIKIFGPQNPNDRGGAVSFIDTDIHPHDLATFLDSNGIAIRAGHHCAQPLTRLMGLTSTARASFYIYNTKNDVDVLITALKNARRYFGYE
jgi:cysteine desulfurase/selenocysteine lyase